jgi:hypothetical protein
MKIGESAEGERLSDGRVVVVGLKGNARDDGDAGLHDGDGPDGDVDGPEGVTGDGVLDAHFGATRGEGDADLFFDGGAVGGRMEGNAVVAMGLVLDGGIVGGVGGGEELGPDPEAMAAVGLPGAEGGLTALSGKLPRWFLPPVAP